MTAALRPLATRADDGGSLRVGALQFRLHHFAGGLPPQVPDRSSLGQAIEGALRDTIDDSDGTYWVVRRIALPFRAEPRLGVAGLAEAFALALRQQIRRILRGEEIDGVRRYGSRAHWLAECVWALANGDAEGQWQFGRYRHHAALPAASAVRLTLAAEPAAALQALALLATDKRIRQFCRRIGEAGARGVVSLATAPGPASARGVDAGLLRLLADEAAATPGYPHAAMVAALARHAAAGAARMPTGASLRRAYAAAVGTAGGRPAFPHDDDRAATLARDTASPASAADADTAALAGSDRSERGRPDGAVAPLDTGFAGIFVLWRSLAGMGLLDLLPAGQVGGPARLAVAAAMAGPHHAAAWADPALHWLCGHCPERDEAPPPGTPELEACFLGHYRDLRGFRGIAPTITPVGRASLLRDRDSEDWLALGSRRRCERAIRMLGAEPVAPPATARDPRGDIDWFGVGHRRARRAWVLLARAAYGDFARRLHGLQGASAAWLWDRLLAGWGTLEPGSPAVMRLPRVQLDLVLRIGGLDGTLLDAPGGQVRLALPGAR